MYYYTPQKFEKLKRAKSNPGPGVRSMITRNLDRNSRGTVPLSRIICQSIYFWWRNKMQLY